MTAVKWTELIDAFEWASFGGAFDNAAFVHLDTGAVFCTSESQELDEEVPDDLETSDRYLPVPAKADLDLGRRLVLSFADEQLPEDYERVVGYFRRAGAYSRFKELLMDRGKLEAWYAFEKEATERALRAWCVDNQIELTDAPAV